MAKNGNLQPFIYVRSTGEKIPVTKAQRDSFYEEADRIRHREQYHHRCMCPRSKWWLCDGDCIDCEFHAPGNILSLEKPVTNENGDEVTLLNTLVDRTPSIEEVIADRELLQHLIAKFRELDPDADRIIKMRLDNPKISDRKIAEALGRKQRTFADQMKRIYTELHRIENK